MARKFYVFLAAGGLVSLLLFPHFCWAQKNNTFSIRGKINVAYRNNITRVPDSLKIADFRSTIFLYAAYRQRTSQRGRWDISYELRNYRYARYQRYHRHDHILYASWQNNLYANVRLHINNELHARFYPYSHLYNYRRNILNAYLSMPGPILQRVTFGYQNWIKAYPNSGSYQNYKSHRIYARLAGPVDSNTRLGLKMEFQKHQGNLYPGSTATNQVLNQNGNRFVLQLFLEKVVKRKIFSSFTYKLENDIPDNPDFDQTGEHVGDENTEELLAEDSDFGYLKHQASLSTLFKINSRMSFMIFYLAQLKNFHYWRIYKRGPKRQDRLIFLSNILKVKVYKNIGIEIQYNYEKNYTNLGFYRYQMSSFLLGLYINE